MKAITSAWILAGSVLAVSGLVQPASAQISGTQIVELTVDIDYYLLNFFNQIEPLPRNVDGNSENAYSILNFFAPSFNFVNHDLDFNGPRRTARASALGGSGVAWSTGPAALAMNPAGMATGVGNGMYVGTRTQTGSGESSFTDIFTPDTGIIGLIDPIAQKIDTRVRLNHDGIYLSGHPFYSAERSGVGGALGRVALGVGYRRFLETYNGTDFLTTWLPQGGVGGLSAEIVTGAQSSEKGGVDAIVLGAATSIGNEDSSVRINIGANANLINGRVQADQVYTVSLLTQIVQELPGSFTDENAFVRQKFEGLAFDIGVQAGLFSDQLRLGAVFRPSYTLEMTSGKYLAVQAAGRSVTILRGAISPYDMETPSTITGGGSLRMDGLVGSGEDRTGIVGFLHRFVGRGEFSAEYSMQNLSETEIVQKNARLDNSGLAEQYEILNAQLNNGGFPGTFDFSTSMPLQEGNALLRDKSSLHFGFETPVWRRETWTVDARFGYETVPLAFPSLVLGDEVQVAGLPTRTPLYANDGTPLTEDVSGSAKSFGLGMRASGVDFDFTVRRLSYEYVTFWNGGTGQQPISWYSPLSGNYEVFPGLEGLTSTAKVSPAVTTFQFGATLHF